MASFLSEDWMAELAEAAALLPERPGLDGVVRFAVSKTPHGKVQFRLVVADGRVTEVITGRDGDQDATVTWAYPEAVAQFRGELDPDGAFMSGRCKVEGDYALYVFGLRPVFGSTEWAGLLADLAGRSTFDEA
ncbi:MAG: SCP2 sterol-binding domain-containing protein [Actinobacteria bacterium]|nr:SCP2 sterol-binding domain-containing protein [Actinomycetota bacterium]